MAYTNLWPATPEASPPDSELANLLAKNIRDLELNIRERMDDAFTDASGRWAVSGPASPIVPADKLTGKKNGKLISIHHSSFDCDHARAFDITRNALYTQQGVGTSSINGVTLWAPLILPDAVTLQTVTFLVNRNGANNITCALKYNVGDVTPATTTIGSVSTTVNGVSLIALSSLAHVVNLSVGRFYFLEVIFPNNAGNPQCRLYGARVVYDTLDCRNTI